MWKRFRPLLLSIFVAMVGGVLTGLGETAEWLGDGKLVVRDIGVALIIAGIVSGTWEAYMRGQLAAATSAAMDGIEGHVSAATTTAAEQLKRVSFDKFLEATVPREAFPEIVDHIVRKPFVRKDCRLAYQLSWLKSHPGYVEVMLETNYTIVNVSDSESNCPVEVYADKTHTATFGDYTPVESVTLEQDGEVVDKWEGDLSDSRVTNEDRFMFKRDVRLSPAKAVQIRVRFRTKHDSNDYDIWSATLLTDGIHIIISHPTGLDVQVNPIHPDYRQKFERLSPSTAAGTQVWRCKSVFLPFQGVEFSWRPTPDAAETVSQDSNVGDKE